MGVLVVMSNKTREVIETIKYIAIIPTAPIIFGIAYFFAWIFGKSLKLPGEKLEGYPPQHICIYSSPKLPEYYYL